MQRLSGSKRYEPRHSNTIASQAFTPVYNRFMAGDGLHTSVTPTHAQIQHP